MHPSRPSLEALPDDVLLYALSFLEPLERFSARPVSRRMSSALRKPAAWLGCDVLDTREFSRRAPGLAIETILPHGYLARVRTLRVADGEAPLRLAELVRRCAPGLVAFECAADGPVAEEVVDALRECALLATVECSGTAHVSRDGLATLRSHPRLQLLDAGWGWHTPSDLVRAARVTPAQDVRVCVRGEVRADEAGKVQRAAAAAPAAGGGGQNVQRLLLCHSTVLTDDALAATVRGMPRLTTLHLCSCTSLTGRGLAALEGRPVERLIAPGCSGLAELPRAALRQQPGKHLLRSLVLSGCDGVDDLGPAFAELARCCRRLTVLNVANTRVRDADLLALAASGELVALEVLVLAGCAGVTDEGVAAAAASPLVELNCCRTAVTAVGVAGALTVARKACSLRVAHLSGAGGEGGLAAAAAAFPALSHLCLDGSEVTDDCLREAVGRGGLLRVEHLVLRRCNGVSARGVAAVACAGSSRLTRIEARHCDALADAQELADALPAACEVSVVSE